MPHTSMLTFFQNRCCVLSTRLSHLLDCKPFAHCHGPSTSLEAEHSWECQLPTSYSTFTTVKKQNTYCLSLSSSSASQLPFTLATGCRLFFLPDPHLPEPPPPVEERLRWGKPEELVGLTGGTLCSIQAALKPCSPRRLLCADAR